MSIHLLAMGAACYVPAGADVDAWTDAARSAMPAGSITSAHWFARDITNERNLYANDADTVLGANVAASTTKVMTGLIVIESGISLSSTTTVQAGEDSTVMGSSTVGLQVGDVVSVEDLLYGLFVESGNDCAEVLARFVGDYIQTQAGSGNGGRVRFLEEMNARAVSLGMTSTVYESPHGIERTPSGSHDAENFTTARDLARVTAVSFMDPTIQTIAGAGSYTMTIVSGPSAPSISLTAGNLKVPELIPGLLAAKGGTLPSTPDHHSRTGLFEMPSGAKVVIVVIDGPESYGVDWDLQAIQYEAMADFPDLSGADTDASFASVTFLSGADDGAESATTTDDSSYGRAVSSFGVLHASVDPIIGPFSYEFDGVDDYLECADAAELSMGSDDFCVEFFLRGTGVTPEANNGSVFAVLIAKWDANVNAREWMVFWDNTSNVRALYAFVSGNGSTTASHRHQFAVGEQDVFFNGAIRHVLMRRSSGAVRLYVNGRLAEGTLPSNVATLFAGSVPMTVGCRYVNGVRGTFADIVMDEIRVTKGSARQTGSSFLPIPRRLARA